MITTDNVTKYYGDFKALDQVNINVNKGSIYGMVGPNGAGKTTLLKILTGVYRQNEGSVFVDNEEVEDNERLKQRICFIPDELFYFPMSSIKAMAKFYEELYDTFDTDRFCRIGELLELDVNKKNQSIV